MIGRAVLGLRARLLLFLLLAIVPALVLTVSTGLAIRHRAISDAEENALRLILPIAMDTKVTVIDGTRQLLASLAQAAEVRDLDPRGCSAILATELKQHTRFINLGAVKRDGTLFCSALPFRVPYNVADRTYFQRAANTQSFSAGTYEIDPITVRSTLNFGYPVHDAAGKVQAVVFGSLDLTRFSRLVSGAQMSPGAVFVVADRQGVVLDRYPDPQHWVGSLMPESLIARKLLGDKKEGAEETVGPDGIRRLYAFTALGDRIGDPDLLLGIGFPSSAAYDIAQMIVRTLIGLGLVAILTFGLAHFSASVLFLRPVNTLVATTQRLNEGDTSTRTNLRHDSGEFGQLAQAIDQLERTESILFALAVAVEAKDPLYGRPPPPPRGVFGRYRNDHGVIEPHDHRYQVWSSSP